MMTIQGVVRGKTIELEKAPGLPEGQAVAVEIRPIAAHGVPKDAPPPSWLERLRVDPSVKPGKFVVKGTRVLADGLVELMAAGRSDQDLRQAHPELTPEDLAAVREYAMLPVEMRRCFGAWADDAEELDKYLAWTRQQRKLARRRVEE